MKVKELLSSPSRWCQRFAARRASGEDCLATAEDATCWCLWGAVRKCYGLYDYVEVYYRISRRLGESPVKWQDAADRTHAEVLAVVTELDI